MACRLCDDLGAVVLSTGVDADFYSCPACIGLCRSDLTPHLRYDAEKACSEVGLPVRWLDEKEKK